MITSVELINIEIHISLNLHFHTQENDHKQFTFQCLKRKISCTDFPDLWISMPHSS